MKLTTTWKVVIVFIGGGMVWALSYLTSLHPSIAMVAASINAAVVGVVSLVTGWQPKTT